MTGVTPTAEFFPEMARTIALGLTTYGPALRLAVSYSQGGDESEREILHDVGRGVGLELIAFMRASALIDDCPPGDDPAPVLPLAQALGESLAILLLATNEEAAARLPMASLEQVDAVYDTAARAWLHRYLDELPERTDEDTHGG
jgi:hypothetical protein